MVFGGYIGMGIGDSNLDHLKRLVFQQGAILLCKKCLGQQYFAGFGGVWRLNGNVYCFCVEWAYISHWNWECLDVWHFGHFFWVNRVELNLFSNLFPLRWHSVRITMEAVLPTNWTWLLIQGSNVNKYNCLQCSPFITKYFTIFQCKSVWLDV